MRKILQLSIAASALILTGCSLAVGPDYERPSIDTPSKFDMTDFNISLSEQNSTISPSWWKVYGDENLSAAIETALESNYDIKVAQAQVDTLLGQFDQVKSGLYPTISGGYGLNRQSVNGSPSAAGNNNMQMGVSSTNTLQLAMASYEIDLWGKVYRATQAARGLLYASEYNKRTIQLGVIANTANNYITLAALESEIELGKQNVEAAADIERLTKKRLEVGTVSEKDYMSAVATLQTAMIDLATLQSTKSTALSTYNVLLGRNPQKVEPTSIYAIKIPDVPAGLPSELLERRPDVAMAEQKLIAQTANIGVAKAAYFPSISLTASFGNQSPQLYNLLTTPALKTWAFGPSINLPIFTGGALAGQLAQANAAQQEALANYKNSIISAFNDADNAIKQNYLAKTQSDYARIKADALKKTLELSKISYQVGTVSYLDLMQVKQQWIAAENAALSAKKSALTASINLYKALGGSWDAKLQELPSLLPAGR